jgi:hypothetical protein
MDEAELCTACRWLADKTTPYCQHPQLGRDLISGEVNCTTPGWARFDETLCSRAGRWFEPRRRRRGFLNSLFATLRP